MNDINKNVLYWTSTLNNIGSLEGTLQYYHHVTQWLHGDSTGGFFLKNLYCLEWRSLILT